MSLNRILLLMLGSVLLTSCGGGDDSDDAFESKVSVPYGMVFLVNGVRDATAVTVQQSKLTSANGYNENCDTDNAAALADETEYCDDERVIGIVTFQLRFINNLLETMPFSYSGLGITIQIERQTGTDPEAWEVVWDSDAYTRTQYRIYGLADYDQTALGTVTSLGPAESYPNQDFAALAFTFLVERNFIDNNGNGKYDQSEDTLVALPGTNGINEIDGSDKCAWRPTFNSATNKYNMPSCQTESLPAGTYRATVHYNFAFDGELTDPPPVIITVNPVAGT